MLRYKNIQIHFSGGGSIGRRGLRGEFKAVYNFIVVRIDRYNIYTRIVKKKRMFESQI